MTRDEQDYTPDVYVPPTEDARPTHFETVDPYRHSGTTGDGYIPIITPLAAAATYPFRKAGEHVQTYRQERERSGYSREEDALLQTVRVTLPLTDAVQDIRRATDADLAGYTNGFDPDLYDHTILPQHRDIVVELDHALDQDVMETVLEDHDYAWTRRTHELPAWSNASPDDTYKPDVICMESTRYRLGGHYRDPHPPFNDHGTPNQRLTLLTDYLRASKDTT